MNGGKHYADGSTGGGGGGVGDNSKSSSESAHDGADTAPPTSATAADESHEEECVICLEELSSQDWGRCTPCGHTFHKKCWWEWENAHNERVDRQRRLESASGRGGRRRRMKDEGPKCCLCNTVNKQFLDGSGDEPAHNPSPFIASDDPGDNHNSVGGNRFTNWFRDIGQEASGFVNFLQSNLSENAGQFSPRRRSSTSNGSGGGGGGVESPSNYFNTNPYNLLLPGTEVVTQGLVDSPHLNHKRGVVVQYYPHSSRYLIQFETNNNLSSLLVGNNNDNSAPVAIKPENLLQTTKVKIVGLRSQPNLNGSTGTICAYSKERNRYVVKVDFLLSPSREISLQPCNIRIPNGTVVRLEGLQQASQWNGKYGTIARWVESNNESNSGGSAGGGGAAGRYEIRLSRQYGVRVKMENVRL